MVFISWSLFYGLSYLVIYRLGLMVYILILVGSMLDLVYI